MNKDKNHLKVEQSDVRPIDQDRREALRRIGKLGAYTAPAMLAMLTSEKAPAATDT